MLPIFTGAGDAIGAATTESKILFATSCIVMLLRLGTGLADPLGAAAEGGVGSWTEQLPHPNHPPPPSGHTPLHH